MKYVVQVAGPSIADEVSRFADHLTKKGIEHQAYAQVSGNRMAYKIAFVSPWSNEDVYLRYDADGLITFCSDNDDQDPNQNASTVFNHFGYDRSHINYTN